MPSWVGRLGVAVWITDPEGNLCFLNERAEALLEVAAEAALGKPCHRVIAGRGPSGELFCCVNCPHAWLARNDAEIEAIILKRKTNAGDQWLRVVTIPVDGPGRTDAWLVHCALPDRSQPARRYLSRVATRSRHDGGAQECVPLTKRELEILEFLADDENAESIAAKLHVSYSTVRNHIQHVLTKLNAHSIEEAVARHLLGS